MLDFEGLNRQRRLPSKSRDHPVVQNSLVSLGSRVCLLNRCIRLIFLQLILYIVLAELPEGRRLASEGWFWLALSLSRWRSTSCHTSFSVVPILLTRPNGALCSTLLPS